MTAQPNAITAAAVLDAYRKASPRLNPPSAADCERIAYWLRYYREAKTRAEALRTIKFDAPGRRRLARAENVRQAIGTLLLELPELVEHLTGRMSGDTEHAQSMADLLTATRKAAALWPNLDGTVRRLDPRTDWARTADCIVGQILCVWQRANPAHRIGKPLSPDQPATVLLADLLHVAGYEGVSRQQIAQHFNRDMSGFVLLDAVGNP